MKTARFRMAPNPFVFSNLAFAPQIFRSTVTVVNPYFIARDDGIYGLRSASLKEF